MPFLALHVIFLFVCQLTCDEMVSFAFYGGGAQVMQGFGIGVRLGMTYDDLRQLVGIHPTTAEEMTLLQVTKRYSTSSTVAEPKIT